ncbi:hypothetical protein FA13DRAFT_114475 [Coprinellus micaceus]|uniref:Uncharacterized protein n=1 Tax=Coprinellus micaceus TaxID=71717 RepID=A0A4Y7TK11_COPMI|nr:hypothetical protein FA13DRAFT_114475 [Coprinellus micaceus]
MNTCRQSLLLLIVNSQPPSTMHALCCFSPRSRGSRRTQHCTLWRNPGSISNSSRAISCLENTFIIASIIIEPGSRAVKRLLDSEPTTAGRVSNVCISNLFNNR